MTLSTTTSRVQYTSTGTGPFTAPFPVLDQTHLVVIKTNSLNADTTLTLTTDYTVSGVGDPECEVTLVDALVSGDRLTIARVVPATQETDYIEGDPFPAESHERALDKLTMIVQQQNDDIDRALTLAISAPAGTSTELPAPESLNLIGWNADANALQNFDATQLAVSIAGGLARTQIFDGNDVQVSFQLSFDAGNASNIDLMVKREVTVGAETFEEWQSQVAGVDFTYEPTTYTFTFLGTPPPTGTGNVVARYSQAINSNAGLEGAAIAGRIGASGLTTNGVRFLGKSTADVGSIEELTPQQMADLLGLDPVPVGTISMFAVVTVPTGWLKCNGQAVSRTTYADLFARIGTYYGAGDGTTTFNVPDDRGEFFRAWDDGRGVDAGRTFGSTQVASAISGQLYGNNGAGAGNQWWTDEQVSQTGWENISTVQMTHPSWGRLQSGASIGVATQVIRNVGETRPRNRAYMVCIKAVAGRAASSVSGGDGDTDLIDIVTETGTSRTMTALDAGRNKYLRCTNAGATTLTFDDAQGYSAGQMFSIRAVGAGGVTLVGDGVTLTPPKGGTLVLEQDDTVTVIMTSGTAGDVMGSTEDA